MKLLTIREVADALRVSVPTVRRLIRRGEIRAGKVGCQIRVPAEALEDYRRGCGLGRPARPNLQAPPDCVESDDEEEIGQRFADRLGLR